MSAEKTFNGLPGWAKGVIAVAAVGATLYGGYLISKKLKALAAERKAKKEVGDVTDDLAKLQKQGKKITLTNSQISAIANSLFTAMDGYGTNFNAIINALILIKNDADMLAVIKSYGVRELSTGKYNPEPNFKGTLSQAITEECSQAEVSALNAVLKKKGIQYHF